MRKLAKNELIIMNENRTFFRNGFQTGGELFWVLLCVVGERESIISRTFLYVTWLSGECTARLFSIPNCILLDLYSSGGSNIAVITIFLIRNTTTIIPPLVNTLAAGVFRLSGYNHHTFTPLFYAHTQRNLLRQTTSWNASA